MEKKHLRKSIGSVLSDTRKVQSLHDIPSSVIIQLARILHTSPNYILLGEVKEEGWMEEMYELMENIKSPEMRRLALKQLRCVAEV